MGLRFSISNRRLSGGLIVNNCPSPLTISPESEKGLPAKASKYFQNNVEILGGEVTIHTIPASNGVWQMRMWIEAEQRRFMRSLRTKNLDEAKVKAKKIYAEVMSETARGKKLFGEKFREVGEQWLLYQKQNQ